MGIVAVSTAATLIRVADAPALAIAAYRMVFASLVAVPGALLVTRGRPGVERRDDRLRLALSGALLAAHFALWIASLERTTVASSVVLVTTSPLWVGLAAPFVLGERVSRHLYAGIGLAFVGAAVIGGGDLVLGEDALVGDLMALGGAIAAAAYFLIGRNVRPRVSLLVYVAWVYGIAALVLVCASLVTATPMTGFDPRTWMAMALLGLVPQILGHSSFNWALRRLSATFVAGAVLGEAVGSTLLAWAILGEAPPATAIVGGAMVLAGLVVAARAETRE